MPMCCGHLWLDEGSVADLQHSWLWCLDCLFREVEEVTVDSDLILWSKSHLAQDCSASSFCPKLNKQFCSGSLQQMNVPPFVPGRLFFCFVLHLLLTNLHLLSSTRCSSDYEVILSLRGVTINWLNRWIDLYSYDPTRSMCLRQVANQIDLYQSKSLHSWCCCSYSTFVCLYSGQSD